MLTNFLVDAEKNAPERGVSQGVNLRVERDVNQGVKENDKYIIKSFVIIYGKFSDG